MINQLNLKFGSSPGEPNLVLTPTSVTVFVGPNNSGKSRIISEIASQCTVGLPTPANVILGDLRFTGLDQAETERAVRAIQVNPDPGASLMQDYIFIEQQGMKQQA